MIENYLTYTEIVLLIISQNAKFLASNAHFFRDSRLYDVGTAMGFCTGPITGAPVGGWQRVGRGGGGSFPVVLSPVAQHLFNGVGACGKWGRDFFSSNAKANPDR